MNNAGSDLGGAVESRAPSNAAQAGPWEMLLYWMSDAGEGSWDRFRTVVAELAGQDRDLTQLRRSLRVRLSDFAYADFFINDSSRWKILPPLAAGLLAPANAAILIGARTPSLVSEVEASAARTGVAVVCETWDDSPAVIRLEGTPSALNACVVGARIDYAEDYAWRLAATLNPIPALLDRPRRDTDHAPINWVPRSFDLHSQEWVDGLRPNTACEFTPRYGRPRYFVSNRRRRLLEVASRRNAVYAAAYTQRISLGAYDAATRTLSAPLSSPFPEAYARVACVCSGRRADVRQGRIAYDGVPSEVATVLLTALGQPPAIAAIAKGIQES